MQNSSKGNNSWKNHRTRTRRWYAHPPSILNIPMKFQWNPTSSFREFAWTRTVPYIFMQNSSKGNNSWKNHRTRTRRWYAHPPLILNIPMKFHWNPTSSFREFAWTRAGRTHGRTDARTHGRTDARTKRRLYAPPKFFGEHNKLFARPQSVIGRLCSAIVLITRTRLYNFDPLKPHFYVVKLGFTGVYIIFLISAQKHRLWTLVRTASLRRF